MNLLMKGNQILETYVEYGEEQCREEYCMRQEYVPLTIKRAHGMTVRRQQQ